MAGLTLTIGSVVSIVMRIQANNLIFCTSTLEGHIENYRSEYYFSDADDPSTLESLIVANIEDLKNQCYSNGKKILGLTIATLGWLFHRDGRFIIKADIAQSWKSLICRNLLTVNSPV